jgi:hypothetical protein
MLKKTTCPERPLLKAVFTVLGMNIFLFAFAQVMPTPASERMKAVEQRQKLEKASVLNDIAFRNVGPSIMSGRVVDLDVNPEDPTEFYVAYSTGGLWQTTNNGQSFTPIMDSLDIIFIGDIAVNWSAPAASRIIWVGTGEANSSRSSYAGTGVYKTNNNGKTWSILAKFNFIQLTRMLRGWLHWAIYIQLIKTEAFIKQWMAAKHGSKLYILMIIPGQLI